MLLILYPSCNCKFVFYKILVAFIMYVIQVQSITILINVSDV